MVDYAMPLMHLVFASRDESVRHEREGTDDDAATANSVAKIGHVPFDAMGYPHIIEMIPPGGTRELLFADDAGRIAGRRGHYVANRRDQETGDRVSAPVAQHDEHGYGSVEIPKGK